MFQKNANNPAARQAATSLSLRVIVAMYIVYLAWSIFSGMRSGESPISPLYTYLISGAFVLSAVAICAVSWRVYQEDLRKGLAQQAAEDAERLAAPAEDETEDSEDE